MATDQSLPVYNILVVGANGGIGRQCIDAALAAGQKVTALLRNPSNLDLTHKNLEIVKGDIMQPSTFEGYLQNKDVVISAIGVKGTGATTLYSEGNAHLIKAMNKNAIKRAFFISASAIEISPVLPFYARFAAKYIVQKLLRNMYADLRLLEQLVKESDVDWTIMRPPRLTNKPVTGHYRVAINSFLKNCLSISRADLADFMIKNISNKAIYKTTIEIAY